MGFLDALKSVGSPSFNKQQALMTIAVAAVKADGTVSDDEVMRLRAMCSLSPLFVRNTSDEDVAIIRFADNVTNQLGAAAIQKAADSLPPALREAAFAFACDMVLADGIIGDEESQFLGTIAQVLRVSEDVGAAVVTATIIRNRAE